MRVALLQDGLSVGHTEPVTGPKIWLGFKKRKLANIGWALYLGWAASVERFSVEYGGGSDEGDD